jgi:hypothetical protein
MMRSYADHRASSAYHGILRHQHDFAAHPLLPSGILVVVHNTVRETWDNYG